MARGTPGFSGADLANLANEAAINAVRGNRDVLTAVDFDTARDRIILGRREGSNVLLPEEKHAVAVHESGHAMVAALSEHADPVAKVTILPAGQTLGVTEQLPLVERHMYGEDYLLDSLAVRLGGRAAELVVIGQGSTGASNDLAGATDLAVKMVREFGLSKTLGPIGYPEGGSVVPGRRRGRVSSRPFAEATQAEIDNEVSRLLRQAEERAIVLLKGHRHELDSLVELSCWRWKPWTAPHVYRLAGQPRPLARPCRRCRRPSPCRPAPPSRYRAARGRPLRLQLNFYAERSVVPPAGHAQAGGWFRVISGLWRCRRTFPSPPINSFHIGPLDVHFYALMYLVGIAVAVILTRRRWRAVGGDPELVGDIALWVVPAGIIGGRIYFDITTPMDIPHVWYGAFAVWSGGLGIWGGVLVGGLVGIWRLRRRGVSPALFADAMAPGLLIAQGIGRIGNYFNKELFGRPTSLPWGLEIPYQYRVSGGIPAAVPALRHVPADLPLRADLRLRLGRRADLARAPLQDQAAGPVRPVRVRLLGVPDLRGVAAHRLLGLHLRPAAEHVHRLGAGRDRRGLVLPHPAPPGPRPSRARPGVRLRNRPGTGGSTTRGQARDSEEAAPGPSSTPPVPPIPAGPPVAGEPSRDSEQAWPLPVSPVPPIPAGLARCRLSAVPASRVALVAGAAGPRGAGAPGQRRGGPFLDRPRWRRRPPRRA